jgi:hypothetical protein
MMPHDLTIAASGGLLWFGWYGFNPGSTLSATSKASSQWLGAPRFRCVSFRLYFNDLVHGSSALYQSEEVVARSWSAS